MNRLFYALILLSLLSGCTSKVSKVTLDAPTQDNYAKMIASCYFCTERGVISQSSYTKFVSIIKTRLANYSYDSHTLNEAAKAHYDNIKLLPESTYRSGCEKRVVDVDNLITEADRQKQLTVENQQYQTQQMQAISTSLNDASNSFQQSTVNMMNITPVYSSPVFQPMGLNNNHSNHYLINTPNGLRNCTVNPSGYTYCN